MSGEPDSPAGVSFEHRAANFQRWIAGSSSRARRGVT